MYLKMERFLFNNHYPTSSNISVHYHEESEGMSCYEAGRILGEDSRTMERWVRRFNEESFNALMEGKRSGRALKLTLSRLI